MAGRFVVCGEALFDLFMEPGQEFQFEARPGGSPLNVAAGLARLDCPVSLLTGLSRDFLGERLLTWLETEGVGTDLLIRSDRPTTLSLVGLSEKGQPAYAFYGDRAADRELQPDQMPQLPADVGYLHFGSYSLVVPPTAESLELLAAQQRENCLISLDPNIRLNVEPDLDLWRERISGMLRHAHLVKVSEEDLQLLYPGQNIEPILADWLGQTPEAIILTLGEKGARAYREKDMVDQPAATMLQATDTVGAGDSFQAALLQGIQAMEITSPTQLRKLDTDRFAWLLTRANKAASYTCMRRGADLPDRSWLDGVAAAD